MLALLFTEAGILQPKFHEICCSCFDVLYFSFLRTKEHGRTG
jgi:hypothetical protein